MRHLLMRSGLALFFMLGIALYAQHDHQASSPAPEKPDKQELAATEDAMSDMHHHGEEAHQHHAGPHMRMSALQQAQPGDNARAENIVAEARTALEQYKDYKAAETDGYRIFLPNVKQKMYHFTNWKYAVEASFRFNAAHPTSLLYEKTGADSYKLIGAMYTAPQRYSEEQLNERIPLSAAQWHQHVNLCVPPRDRRQEMLSANPKFGLMGSITTQSECQSAGGNFKPVIFGWMVHFYPYEKSMDQIWSVERQLASAPAVPQHQH
jgi:hypothetical protein